MNAFTTLPQRFHSRTAAALEDSLLLREGDVTDYAALAEHHYLTARPATMTRVLVLEHAAPSISARFGRADAAPALVAVLVESLPPLNSALRDWAMHNRYGSLRDLKARAAVLNREIRCISRVVVHPQWRGLGLAVRLVHHALATAITPVTEAFAAMGHVNPFFEKAGMIGHRRAPHAFDRRLLDAMATAGLAASQLTMPATLIAAIAQLTAPMRRLITRELVRWHRQTVGRRRDSGHDLPTIVRAARDRLLLEPVYYVHVRA